MFTSNEVESSSRLIWSKGRMDKVGLFTSESEDEALLQSLLDIMQDNEADFTLTFRRLCETALSPGREGSLQHLFKDAGAYDKWATN